MEINAKIKNSETLIILLNSAMFYGRKSLVPFGTDGFDMLDINFKDAKVRFLYQTTMIIEF